MARHDSTIVVGIDGAWRRTGAVDWALDEAARHGDRIHLVHVVDDRFPQLAELARENTSTAASALVGAIGDGDIQVQADTLPGTPGVVLADVASTARLLVVGRRGIGTFERLLVGSNSESAVNHADCAVVVVPDGWDPAAHAAGPVVAGVDVTAPSADALAFAFAEAAERSVPVRLVHFWDLPAGYVWDGAFVSDELNAWREHSSKAFDEIAGQWHDKYPQVEIQPVLRQGHPVDGLVREADGIGAQLVVVGGHRHHRVASVLLGSVARGVLHHAGRPLAVVHDPRSGAGR